MAAKGAPKKRRLSDLYIIGREVQVDDGSGDGEPVGLYMRRPNPFEHEEALRDGNASRARITLKMRDKDTDDHEILEADLMALGNIYEQVDFIIRENDADILTRAYGAVSNEDKWSDDGLIDSIQDNLEKWYTTEPALKEGDEDWDDFQRAVKTVEEFNSEVETKADGLRAEQRIKLLENTPDEIKDMCRKILIDRAAGLAFFRDYRISCIYFGTREPDDHGKRYFSSKQEIRELPFEIQTQLLREYDRLDMGRDEVKNSPSADPSSLESAQSEAVETSEPSGLVDATA